MAENLRAEWFWGDRWMRSSAFLLPLEPRGLYREMLTQAWIRGGSLPSDPRAIQRACGVTEAEWERCWPLVERFWEVEGGSLYNATQREILAESVCRKDAASALGKRRAETAKRGKGGRFSPSAGSSGGPAVDPSAGRHLRSSGGPANDQPPDPSPDQAQTQDLRPPLTPLPGGKRKRPEPGPQDRLARKLADALGSSLNICRKQIVALRGAGMTLEQIEPFLARCIPGMAPWEWTRRVTQPGSTNVTTDDLDAEIARLRAEGR